MECTLTLGFFIHQNREIALAAFLRNRFVPCGICAFGIRIASVKNAAAFGFSLYELTFAAFARAKHTCGNRFCIAAFRIPRTAEKPVAVDVEHHHGGAAFVAYLSGRDRRHFFQGLGVPARREPLTGEELPVLAPFYDKREFIAFGAHSARDRLVCSLEIADVVFHGSEPLRERGVKLPQYAHPVSLADLYFVK